MMENARPFSDLWIYLPEDDFQKAVEYGFRKDRKDSPWYFIVVTTKRSQIGFDVYVEAIYIDSRSRQVVIRSEGSYSQMLIDYLDSLRKHGIIGLRDVCAIKNQVQDEEEE